jgi:hypothetical protein
MSARTAKPRATGPRMAKRSRKAKAITTIAAFPAQEWFSVDQLEAISNISKWTWRRWAQTGRIESLKVSTRLLISRAEFERIMSEAVRPAQTKKVG